MATVLEECTTEGQPFVVRFLWAKELSAKDVHEEMCPVYGGKCFSRKAVHSWVDKFSQGRSKFVDDARPCRPVVISTEVTQQQLEELVRADRRAMTNSVATALWFSIQRNA
jgi:hypothetical protein